MAPPPGPRRSSRQSISRGQGSAASGSDGRDELDMLGDDARTATTPSPELGRGSQRASFASSAGSTTPATIASNISSARASGTVTPATSIDDAEEVLLPVPASKASASRTGPVKGAFSPTNQPPAVKFEAGHAFVEIPSHTSSQRSTRASTRASVPTRSALKRSTSAAGDAAAAPSTKSTGKRKIEAIVISSSSDDEAEKQRQPQPPLRPAKRSRTSIGGSSSMRKFDEDKYKDGDDINDDEDDETEDETEWYMAAKFTPKAAKGKGQTKAMAKGKGKIVKGVDEDPHEDADVKAAPPATQQRSALQRTSRRSTAAAAAAAAPAMKGDSDGDEELVALSLELASEGVSDVPEPASVATKSKGRRAAANAASIKTKAKAALDEYQVDDDNSGSDSDFEPVGYSKRASRSARQARLKRDIDIDSDASSLDGSDDSELSDEDAPLAAGSSAGPSTGLAAGSMREEQQYETAKQRAARLRSERRQARLKNKNVRSQYEKNKRALVAHHPELKDVWEKLRDGVAVIKPEQAEQPAGLNIKLLPFQREGLDWLKRQEAGPWKGGMLADEMGMGKTIQMISLMLSDRQKPCLVLAPTVAIMQWRNEIEQYTEPRLKVELWHGANRTQDADRLRRADVVLTSYAVLESCYRKQETGFQRKKMRVKEDSVLHAIHWRRIILDEAHNIKERATNTAKGAFALKGDFRWCLSGTPLQNRVGELYSMIRFLGGDPYAFYFCKKCPCKSLHWQFSDRRNCDSCGHTPMHHTCFWNNEILKPIQKNGAEQGEGKDAFGRLRLLLERMMLRRTKLERADDMGLPPRTIEVRRDLFNEEEEDLYTSLYSDTTRKFSTYLDQGTVLNNYSNIFTLLTRMRQIANHPDLVLRSQSGVSNRLLGEQQDEHHVCKICADVAEDAIMSRCRHVFCRECVRQYLETDLPPDAGAPDCPYCHATLSIDLEGEALEPPQPLNNASDGGRSGRQGILSRLDMDQWRSSTKIEALVEELTQLRAEDKTIKSLVFSQFVNFLDLIAFRLQRAGFQICRLEGNMSPEARNKTIKHFMENPNVTVFLVSLKAGGVALNLTEASRVYLMDPWWNPSVEVQAMDRIHRLGQHRPIIVKRMIIENSIESRIIELQNKKSAMIEAAIGKDESAMGRLSVADLRFLFTL